MKKKVIAYLHTHWDREWYREYEVFRLRLIRVFDNILELLEQGKIPCFYFDGQVGALLDYLEFRPGKEALVRRFCAEKKLFIGPCYCLLDEFLTDRKAFEKTLELGLKISRDFGCNDFIGYLADTFGHSKKIPEIFKKYGIDKCMVWRGCGDIPSEFKFCGIDTVNLIRGYFMDIFSAQMAIDKKAEWMKGNLDKIAAKSSDTLLLPIGADHLGVESDITEQINAINERLDDYEIVLGSPFDYFEAVKDNFDKFIWEEELRDNSLTFILPGCYSARTKLKQMNVECSYKLALADKYQKYYGSKYDNAIEYAYKLLLKNLAHDGICGCSTDAVHKENMIRYEKILQIADTIIKELKFANPQFVNFSDYTGVVEFESPNIEPDAQVISERYGFEDALLYDTQRIPVTEDYKKLYKQIKELKPSSDELKIAETSIKNSHISLIVKENTITVASGDKNCTIEFERWLDEGDTYNFGAVENDIPQKANIIGSEIFYNGKLRVGLLIKTTFFNIVAYLNKNSELVNFKIDWNNTLKNRLWQVKFNLCAPVTETYSEDMNTIIKRNFDPDYDMRANLPKVRGIEVKTNFAPMQRFVGSQGLGIITRGLTEYEVSKNSLKVTLLRSTGVISNPKNPARSTPAGPPLEVTEAQQTGRNTAEFSIGFFDPQDYQKYIDEVFPMLIP